MLESLQQWMNDPLFMPHGHCFLWTPTLTWLYIVADGMIVAAYYSIPPALWYFARKRTDLKYRWLVVLFGVFIIACGTTHLLKIWNIWNSAYWLDAYLTLFTGIVSIACAMALWPLMPKILALPRREQLEEAYRALSDQHAQLRESEQRYRLLIETSAEGIWILDPQGNTTFANTAIADLLGCADGPNSLIGRNILEFVDSEDHAAADQHTERRLAGIKEKYEFRFRRADGSVVHTIVSAAPLRDGQGEVSGRLGVITDISDRVLFDRRMQQLNRELEERVQQRTDELDRSNLDLAREVVAREYVQQELKASNEQLNTLLQQLAKHNENITHLNELNDSLHACNTRAELLQTLGEGCAKFFQYESGALYEWRDDKLCMLECAWGEQDHLDWLPQQDVLTALRKGTLFPDSVEQQEWHAEQVTTPHGYVLCAPLQSRGVSVGALVLVQRQPFWSNDTIANQKLRQLVRALADHSALALINLTLLEQLREQSISDPLTGLYNRRYLYQEMQQEIALWERSRTAFAVILLDIDHFKTFNDRYGHDTGDEVLVALADLLQQHIRKSDIACRLGGEEFVVLLTNTDQRQALARAETIRLAVKKLIIDSIDTDHRISVSAGVAIYPHHGDDSQQLLRAADQALYESKHQGRDRTSLAVAAPQASNDGLEPA
ncbi:MAG TPA: diguanylate cyclase [Spongiibacteraceae bacterium]|nr:diguanylate cyclase [Spongiibacteraceae bacterium]